MAVYIVQADTFTAGKSGANASSWSICVLRLCNQFLGLTTLSHPELIHRSFGS